MSCAVVMGNRSVVLVHGFNVRDSGAGSTDLLKPPLEASGYVVSEFDYGWIGLLGAKVGAKRRAQALHSRHSSAYYAIGHSNGCALIWRAAWLGSFNVVVLLNPALDRDVQWPPHLSGIHVYHTFGDMPTKLATYIPGVVWGSMGCRGALGGDHRIHNHRMDSPDLDPAVRISSHSGIFGEARDWWFDNIQVEMARYW